MEAASLLDECSGVLRGGSSSGEREAAVHALYEALGKRPGSRKRARSGSSAGQALKRVGETEKQRLLSALMRHVNDGEVSSASRIQACGVLSALVGDEPDSISSIKWKRLSKALAINIEEEPIVGSGHDGTEIALEVGKGVKNAKHREKERPRSRSRTRRPKSRERALPKVINSKKQSESKDAMEEGKKKEKSISRKRAQSPFLSGRQSPNERSPNGRSRVGSPKRNSPRAVSPRSASPRAVSPRSGSPRERIRSKPGVVGVLLGPDATNVKDEYSTYEQLGYNVPMMWYPEKREINGVNKHEDGAGSKMKEKLSNKLPPIETQSPKHQEEAKEEKRPPSNQEVIHSSSSRLPSPGSRAKGRQRQSFSKKASLNRRHSPSAISPSSRSPSPTGHQRTLSPPRTREGARRASPTSRGQSLSPARASPASRRQIPSPGRAKERGPKRSVSPPPRVARGDGKRSPRSASPKTRQAPFSPKSPLSAAASPMSPGSPGYSVQDETKFVIETMEKLRRENEQDLENILDEEKAIWYRINRAIRSQRLTFPTDFLLSQGLEVAHSREIARRVMDRIFNFAGREPMRAPFRKWHDFVLAERFKEFVKYASYEKCRVVIRRMLQSKLILGWQKWVEVTEYEQLLERTRVTINLQRTRRGILGRRKFAIHKRRWYASRRIETWIRMWTQVYIYRDLLRRTIVVQRYARMWAVQGLVATWHAAAVPIQSVMRMFVRRWEFLELKAATLLIQANYRGVLGRVRIKRLMHEHMLDFQTRWVAVERLQYFWRLVKARRSVQAIIDHETSLTNAALKIQTFWYKYTDYLPSFIMMRCYSIQDDVDRIKKRWEKRDKRREHATQIQTQLRRVHAQRLLARLKLEFDASCMMQSLVRSFVARQKVKRWRHINVRVRSIQRMVRAYLAPRNDTARLIQRWWQGLHAQASTAAAEPPLAPHAPSARQRRINYTLLWRQQYDAANRIQNVARAYPARNALKQWRAARQIQSIYLMHRAIVLRSTLYSQVCDKVVHSFVDNFLTSMHHETALRLSGLRRRSAMCVQSWYRMVKTKQNVAVFRKYVAKRNRNARQIQRVRRGYACRVRLAKERALAKRVRTNRYRSIECPLKIAQDAIRHARTFYDPADPLAGMHPVLWLHRLGLSEYWEGLNQGAFKVSDLSRLLSLQAKALTSSGVENKDHVRDIQTMQKLTQMDVSKRTVNNHPAGSHQQMLLGSLGYIRTPSAAKEMYAKFFPGQDTRASNFAQKMPIPDAVTYVQLWRYLCKYVGRPKEAKDNVEAELLTTPDANTVRQWQIRRFKQCFAIYEMALESISRRHLSDDLEKIVTDALLRGRRPGLESTQLGCNELWVALAMVAKVVLAAQTVQRNVRSKLARMVFHARLRKQQYRQELLEGGLLKANWMKERELERKEWEEYVEACRRYEVEQCLMHITRFGFSEVWDAYSQAYYYEHTSGDPALSLWERPLYTYEEDRTTIRIQTQMRGYLARAERARLAYLYKKELAILRARMKWEACADERLNLVTFRIKLIDLEDGAEEQGKRCQSVDEEFQLGLSLSWRKEKHPVKWADAVRVAEEAVVKEKQLLASAEAKLFGLQAEFDAMRQRSQRGRSCIDLHSNFVKTGKDLRALGTYDLNQSHWELEFEDASPTSEACSDELAKASHEDHEGQAAAEGSREEPGADAMEPELAALLKQEQDRKRKGFYCHRILQDTRISAVELERRFMEQNEKPSKESEILAPFRAAMAKEDAYAKAREADEFGRANMTHLAQYQNSSAGGNAYDRKVRARKQNRSAIKLTAFVRGFLVRYACWRRRLMAEKAVAQERLACAQESMTAAEKRLASLYIVSRSTSKFTFVALQFGWVERRDGYGRTYFLHEESGERTWDRPVFQWNHEAGARHVQRVFRGWRGRVSFINALRAEGVSRLVQSALRKAKSQAWIGYEDEGVSVSMWFARRGLYHILKDTMESKPNSSKMLNRNFAWLVENLSLPWTEKSLGTLGITNPAHVKEILQYQTQYPAEENDSAVLPLRNSELARELFLSFFSNQGARAIKFAQQAALLSDMPITLRQLERHLNKYQGKPSLATVQLQDEVFNLPTASTPAAEEESYYTMVGAVRRVMIVAANMKISKLQSDLETRLATVQALIAPRAACEPSMESSTLDTIAASESEHTSISLRMSTETDTGNGLPPGPWHCKRAWPREATAGYAARLILNFCLGWEDAAIKVQRKYRDYYSLMRWRETAAWYRAKVVLIQCCWRQHAARTLVNFRRQQFHSPWEELFDSSNEAYYYFDNRSQRSQWHPPFVPYKPHGWWPPHPDDIPVPQGMCYICRTEEAIRRCNQCITKNQVLREFCFECFAKVHDFGGLEFANHTFTPIMSTEDEAVAQNGGPGLKCGQCSGPASRKCDECSDFYCLACFRRFHNRGKRSTHSWTAYTNTAVACIECEQDVATLLCADCDEQYCQSCFTDLHRKGQRKKHSYTELPSQVSKTGKGL